MLALEALVLAGSFLPHAVASPVVPNGASASGTANVPVTPNNPGTGTGQAPGTGNGAGGGGQDNTFYMDGQGLTGSIQVTDYTQAFATFESFAGSALSKRDLDDWGLIARALTDGDEIHPEVIARQATNANANLGNDGTLTVSPDGQFLNINKIGPGFKTNNLAVNVPYMDQVQSEGGNQNPQQGNKQTQATATGAAHAPVATGSTAGGGTLIAGTPARRDEVGAPLERRLLDSIGKKVKGKFYDEVCLFELNKTNLFKKLPIIPPWLRKLLGIVSIGKKLTGKGKGKRASAFGNENKSLETRTQMEKRLLPLLFIKGFLMNLIPTLIKMALQKVLCKRITDWKRPGLISPT